MKTSESEAIQAARNAVAQKSFVDATKVLHAFFSSREQHISRFGTAGPGVRDCWIVTFRRKKEDFDESTLAGIFDDLSVSVDDETREAHIMESL